MTTRLAHRFFTDVVGVAVSPHHFEASATIGLLLSSHQLLPMPGKKQNRIRKIVKIFRYCNHCYIASYRSDIGTAFPVVELAY